MLRRCGVERVADLVVFLTGQGGRILLLVLLEDPGVGALAAHAGGLCLLVEAAELRVAEPAGALALSLTLLALSGGSCAAGALALCAEVVVVGVVLALVDCELLEKVVFQGVGVGCALGLGRVVVPADRVDHGLDGLVLVVEVRPADRQVGLVEEHELVAVAGLGLHGDPVQRVAVVRVLGGRLGDDVEVDAELVHDRGDLLPHVVDLGVGVADAVAVLLLQDLWAGFPHFDELLPKGEAGGHVRQGLRGLGCRCGFLFCCGCHGGPPLQVDLEDVGLLRDGDAFDDLAGLGDGGDAADEGEPLLQLAPLGALLGLDVVAEAVGL